MIWKVFLQNFFQKCSRSQMFFKIGVIKNFLIFTRKNLCWSLFLMKLQDWWPATLSKKRPQHMCFPVSITKCLRKAFFMESLWWLLLKMAEEFLRISKGGQTICMYDSQSVFKFSLCLHHHTSCSYRVHISCF